MTKNAVTYIINCRMVLYVSDTIANVGYFKTNSVSSDTAKMCRKSCTIVVQLQQTSQAKVVSPLTHLDPLIGPDEAILL